MRFLKLLLGVIFSLLLIVMTIAGGIFIFPDLVLNHKTLSWLNQRFISPVSVDWGNLSFETEYLGLLERKIKVNGHDFCVEHSKSKACFKRLSLTLLLSKRFDHFFDIKNLIIEDEEVNIVLVPDSERSQEFAVDKTAKALKGWGEWLRDRWPESVDILINNAHVHSGGRNLDFVMLIKRSKLHAEVRDQNDLQVVLDLQVRDNSINGKLVFEHQSISAKIPIAIDVEESIALHANPEIIYKQASKKMRSVVDQKFSAKVNLKLGKDRLSLSLFDLNFKFKKYLERVDIPKCNIEVLYYDPDDMFEILCPEILLKTNTNRFQRAKKAFSKQIEVELAFKFSANLKEKLPVGASGRNGQWASFHITGENKNPEIWSFSTDLRLGLNKTEETDFQILPETVAWSVVIDDFQKFVKALKGTYFAVPAPTNSLQGSLSLHSDQPIRRYKNRIKIPITFDVSLNKAKTNKLDFSLDGIWTQSLNRGGTSGLQASVVIDQVHAYLPKIDPIKGLPPLKRGERITKEIKTDSASKKQSSGVPSFEYDISIQTSRPDAIRIYYYLFKPYLALALNADLKQSAKFQLKNSGETIIEYLRRKIVLQNLELSKGIKNDDMPLNIKFLYETSGYKIYLTVMGTVSQPRLMLDSMPSLSREDIISLVLYNRKASNITSFEQESVGGAEAAIADRTLGLLGIWAFASTPIESVRYNPADQSYSAQIALPGGVHFDIGTDWERVNSLSFRKHLSDSWVIVTSYLPGESDEGTGNVMLQKEIRFK